MLGRDSMSGATLLHVCHDEADAAVVPHWIASDSMMTRVMFAARLTEVL